MEPGSLMQAAIRGVQGWRGKGRRPTISLLLDQLTRRRAPAPGCAEAAPACPAWRLASHSSSPALLLTRAPVESSKREQQKVSCQLGKRSSSGLAAWAAEPWRRLQLFHLYPLTDRTTPPAKKSPADSTASRASEGCPFACNCQGHSTTNGFAKVQGGWSRCGGRAPAAQLTSRDWTKLASSASCSRASASSSACFNSVTCNTTCATWWGARDQPEERKPCHGLRAQEAGAWVQPWESEPKSKQRSASWTLACMLNNSELPERHRRRHKFQSMASDHKPALRAAAKYAW